MRMQHSNHKAVFLFSNLKGGDTMNEKIAELKGLCREWTKEHTQVLAEKF